MSDTIDRTPEATAPTTSTAPPSTTPTPTTPSAPPGRPERRTAVIAVTVALLFAVVLVVVEGSGSEVPSHDEITRRLINEGLVPSGDTSEPSAAWHAWASQSGQLRDPQAPLYTAAELATMKLVREGRLPASTLGTDRFVTKQLANRGLIPRAAAQ
jgi:hypothetical protein